MNKIFIFFLFCNSFSASAQQNLSIYDSNFIQHRFRGYVVLNNNTKIEIEGLGYADSLNVRLYSNTPGSKKVPATFKGDVRNMEKIIIPISDIKEFKGKRMAFVKGAGVGALLGYGAGYAAGYIKDGDDEDSRATIFGIIGAIPVAVAGGLIGSVVLQKKFKINGNKTALDKALKKFYR